MKYIEFLKLNELDLELPGDEEKGGSEPEKDPIKDLQDAEKKKQEKEDNQEEKKLNKTEQKIVDLLKDYPDLLNTKLYNKINKALESGDLTLIRSSKQQLMIMQTRANPKEIEILGKIGDLLDNVDSTNT